jgi:hypothetical protein
MIQQRVSSRYLYLAGFVEEKNPRLEHCPQLCPSFELSADFEDSGQNYN